MLEQLTSNPFVQLSSIVIGILGVILAIIFYLKTKEKKEFSYFSSSISFITKEESKYKKLSVTYDGQKIDNFCVTKFYIWNSGNKTINASDMADYRELTLTTSGEGRILDADIIACSDDTNKFSVQVIDKQTLKIPFNYVDINEGIIVQIQHTGIQNIFEIDCKIKGGMPIKHKQYFFDKYIILCIIDFIIFIAFYIWHIFDFFINLNFADDIFLSFLAILATLFFAWCLYYFYKLLKRLSMRNKHIHIKNIEDLDN